MPKKTSGTSKRKKSEERVSETRPSSQDEESAPDEPSNCKQKKFSRRNSERSLAESHRRGRSSDRKRESVNEEENLASQSEEMQDSAENSQKSVVNASFQEGEDKVDMEVYGSDEFLDEETEMETEHSQTDYSESEESTEEGDSQMSDLGTNSQNDNSNARRSRAEGRSEKNKVKTKNLVKMPNLTEDSSDEEMDAAEFRSMKKFTHFLEKSGFINKQGGGDNEIREKNYSRKHSKKSHSKQGNQYLSLDSSTSATTIYQQALPLVIEDSPHKVLNYVGSLEQNINGMESEDEVILTKVMSDSSEEKFNSSDETIPVETPEEIENDQILFKQFLEYKHWERRIRKGDVAVKTMNPGHRHLTTREMTELLETTRMKRRG